MVALSIAKRERRAIAASLVAVVRAIGIVLCLAGRTMADGDDFFLQDDGSPPILQYFGHVRDPAGKPIGGVSIFVEVKHPRVFVNTKSFPDGGYKAPDIGLYIGQMGGAIDFSLLEIRCVKAGYATAHLKVPAGQQGRVTFDIVMTTEP